MDVPALRLAPVLDPYLGYYYECYQELSASRNYTHGYPLSIPISEIKAYCEFERLDETESRQMRMYVRMFDNIWLSIRAEAAKKEAEASKVATR